jgi:hypothetical protein
MATPSPYEAPVLKRLKAALDARWPNRDRTLDGWIGDAAHQARTSDHNPDRITGVVRARDIDKDGVHRPTVLASLLSHPSTAYVVWNHRIFRYADRFYPRHYDGSNPHTDHFHESIKATKLAETSVKPWVLIPGFKWRELRVGMTGEEVRQLQAYLVAYEIPLRLDTTFGVKTLAAVKLFQKRHGLQVDGLVGPKTQRALANG